MNTVGQLIDYQKKCTEIWNRQIDALSRTDEEAESEGEEMVRTATLFFVIGLLIKLQFTVSFRTRTILLTL